MFKTIKQFAFALTEKGVLKPAQTKSAKEACMAKLVEAGFTATPNGHLVVQIGETSTGEAVWFKLEPAVTKADVMTEKAKRTAKPKETKETETVVSLFGE